MYTKIEGKIYSTSNLTSGKWFFEAGQSIGRKGPLVPYKVRLPKKQKDG
jgi:hypothetical protein